MQNENTLNGALLYSLEGSVHLKSSSIKDINGGNDGGAIYLESEIMSRTAVVLTLEDVQAEGCRSEANGGFAHL